MALDSIHQMVKEKLPYLVEGEATDQAISTTLKKLFYEMQPQTLKTDEEVENENSYTAYERIFFAEYVAYRMLQNKITSQTLGIAGTAPEVIKTVKKAKADVVETEFEVIKGGQLSPTELMDLLKISLCQKAQLLKFQIEVCSQPAANYFPGSFLFIPGT